MNINLREVICTSKVSFLIFKNIQQTYENPSLQDGDRFWRMNECYIRGSTIKYLRIPDEVIDLVKEDVTAKARSRQNNNQQQNRNNNQQKNFGNKNRNMNRNNMKQQQ